MREIRLSGSVRGVRRNPYPYRDPHPSDAVGGVLVVGQGLDHGRVDRRRLRGWLVNRTRFWSIFGPRENRRCEHKFLQLRTCIQKLICSLELCTVRGQEQKLMA